MKDIIALREEESGKIKINLTEIDIINFLKELIDEVKAGLKEHPNVNFIHQVDSFKAIADKKLLRQIFQNLISNAVKFTSSKRNVFIIVSSNQKTFNVEIKDEGIGIPKEDLEKEGYGEYLKLFKK